MDELPHGLSTLEPMLGTWTGSSTGVFGTAVLTRTGEYVLQDRFIRLTTRSVSEREVHEDIAFFSYDQERETIVMREFHAEGYVNRYVLVEADDGVLTFESEHIENPFDPTLRARTVIRLTDPPTETLELATDGGPFRACVDVRLEHA
jgi:hypothetical protein